MYRANRWWRWCPFSHHSVCKSGVIFSDNQGVYRSTSRAAFEGWRQLSFLKLAEGAVRKYHGNRAPIASVQTSTDSGSEGYKPPLLRVALLASSPVFNKPLPLSEETSPVSASSEIQEEVSGSPTFQTRPSAFLKLGSGPSHQESQKLTCSPDAIFLTHSILELGTNMLISHFTTSPAFSDMPSILWKLRDLVTLILLFSVATDATCCRGNNGLSLSPQSPSLLIVSHWATHSHCPPASSGHWSLWSLA